MRNEYSVTFGKDTVGKVQVLQEGLYYRFICRCILSGEVICRLAVCCGDKQENLGVVVPSGQGFGLEKRIPVKRIGTGPMRFVLMPKCDLGPGTFVPIYPEEPFAYLSRLKNAFLVRQSGQLGAVIPDINSIEE